MRRWVAVVSLAAVFSGRAALAQPAPCTDEPRVCGKRAFDAGVEAFGKGDFKTALEHFRVAQAIQNHPIVSFNLALAEARTDLVLEARARLDELLTNPQVDASLLEKAKQERASLDRAVATVKIDVSGGTEVELDVSGRTVKGNPASIEVNPGKQHVRVTVDDRVAIDRDVELSRGEKLTLNVDREKIMDVGPTPPPSGAANGSPDQGAQPEPGGGLSPTFFWVGVGVTAVLGGVTVWSGLDVQKSKSDFEKLPDGTPQKQEALDDGHGKETRTNVLIAGTAVAAVGTAALGLFLVDWKSTQAALVVGPRSALVGFSGTF